MKRFEFRLEGILRYRGRVEKEKRIGVSRAGEALAGQGRLMREADAAAAHAREELRKDTGLGEIDLTQARQQRRHVDALAEQAEGMTRRLRMLEGEFAARRDEAVRAQRERKVLDNLRARRHAAHVRGSERAEQKELDDVAVKNTWVRRSGSEERTE